MGIRVTYLYILVQASFIAMLSSGCATYQAGSSDYRPMKRFPESSKENSSGKTETTDPVKGQTLAPAGAGGANVVVKEETKKEEMTKAPVAGAEKGAAGAKPPEVNVPSTLEAEVPEDGPAAKYSARFMDSAASGPVGDTSIKPGDSIYISLSHAFITDFFENDGMRKAFGLNPNKKVGEIAIVANVHEIGNDADFDFSSSGAKSGRVIYYSEGVHPNSHLNFSNIPIYGPIKYKGRPLAISFYIIELDNDSNETMKAVLKTVSGIGQKAYPPSSPALKVLDKIGSTLLERGSDDMELAYHFMLDPVTAEAGNPPYAQLRTGNFVLIKRSSENAQVQKGLLQDWTKVVLNEASGTLYRAGADGFKSGNAFTESTYLVFQIKKNFNSDNLDNAERGQKLSEFIQKQTGAGPAAAITDTGDMIKTFLSRDLAAIEVDKQIALLQAVKDRSDSVAKGDQVRILEAIREYVTALPGTAKSLSAVEKENILLRVAQVYTPTRITPFTLEELNKQLADSR